MFFMNPADSTHRKAAKDVVEQFAQQFNLGQEYLELWYDKVERSLHHLLSNTFGKQGMLERVEAAAYQETVRHILKHPQRDKFLSKAQTRTLERGLNHIIADVNKHLDEAVSPADIALFCQVAERGRDHFQTQNIDPRYFAEDELLDLAVAIRGNYAAYSETLRGPQV